MPQQSIESKAETNQTFITIQFRDRCLMFLQSELMNYPHYFSGCNPKKQPFIRILSTTFTYLINGDYKEYPCPTPEAFRDVNRCLRIIEPKEVIDRNDIISGVVFDSKRLVCQRKERHKETHKKESKCMNRS
eukprot:731830_1